MNQNRYQQKSSFLKKITNVIDGQNKVQQFVSVSIIGFLIYLILTLLIFHHRLPFLDTRYAMPDIDTDGGLWYQWFLVFLEQKKELYEITDYIGFPFGFDITFKPFETLIYSVHIALLKMFGFSWQNLILITNISSLLVYPLAAISAACLCFYLTRSYMGSFVCGLIYAFSFSFVLAGRGQMSINHIEFIPLYFLSLFYFLNRKSIVSLVLSAFVFSITFNADAYYAFFCGLISIVIVLFYQKESILSKIRTIGVYYGALLVLLVLLNLNFIISNILLFDHQYLVQSGRVTNYRNELLPLSFYFSLPETSIIIYLFNKSFSYFGALIPIILIIGLFFQFKNRVYKTLFFCALIAVILSAYTPLFYWLNQLYFHYFGMFRSVARMYHVVYLFQGLMIGVLITQIAGKKKILISLLLAFFVVAIGLNHDASWKMYSDFSKIAKLYEPIKENSSIKVIAPYPVELDFVDYGNPRTYQLLGQIVHNKKIVTGASPFSKESIEYQKKIKDISSQDTIDLLVKYNVDTIIIYNNLLPNSLEINKTLLNNERLKFVGRYTQPIDSDYVTSNNKSRDISVYQIKEVVSRPPKNIFTIENGNVYTKKISQYQYEIFVPNINPETVIVFDQPFSDKWQIYNGSQMTFNTLAIPSIAPLEAEHITINDYANGWKIKNIDANSSLKATVLFTPSIYIQISSLIRNIVLICLAIYFIMYFWRLKNKNTL